jgi:phosphoadenosine phosphosulfate reductase
MDVAALCARLKAASLVERVQIAARAATGRVVFTTSFGLEDQVVLDAIAASGEPIEFVTLDTGRLFPETYELWAQTEARYGLRVAAVFPRTEAVEALVDAQGIDGFRASQAARRACCEVRKVEPLRRALAGSAGWITGLRADQSAHRAATPFATFDEVYQVLKINPLADWRRADVARYVADRGVPYNLLHDRGFLSIGCAPCTRAVRVGEPERAGRWWWEEETKKECGLHLGNAAEGPLRQPAEVSA